MILLFRSDLRVTLFWIKVISTIANQFSSIMIQSGTIATIDAWPNRGRLAFSFNSMVRSPSNVK